MLQEIIVVVGAMNKRRDDCDGMAGVFDTTNQPEYNPRCARLEYAGLLGTGERKVRSDARPDGL